MNCLNCGSPITCGCQKRTASDGNHCCSNCITTYENKLKAGNKKDDQTLTPQQVIAINK